jgi:PAS domain-containing protein
LNTRSSAGSQSGGKGLDYLAQLTPGIGRDHGAEGYPPDGQVRYQQWTDRAFFDAQGNVLGYQSVVRDITEKRLAEEKLHESERRFRHLVESTNIVPYTWDLQTRRYTYVGPQAEKLLGYPVSAWTAKVLDVPVAPTTTSRHGGGAAAPR